MITTDSRGTPFPFICIEGVDGVGKTTVAQKLAALLCGTYYKTPPPPYDSIRVLVDKQGDPTARFYFYLSSVAFASAEIAKLRVMRPVVCDRYVFSTVAYHAAIDRSFHDYAIPTSLLMPDETFLLVVDESERLNRLTSRQEVIPRHDAAIERNGALLAAVLREFCTFNCQVIDTTNLSVEETVERIRTRLSAVELRS